MSSLRFLVAAALSLLPGIALAQSTLLQGGSRGAGRVPMYVNNGSTGQVIVQDSGPASGGGPGVGVSEFNITARGTGTAPYAGQGTGPNGEVACIFDAPSTNTTGYHSLCFSANVSSGGLISYQANGAASSLPFNFMVNGTTYEFPFTTTGVVGPATSTVGNAACWNNTSGTLLADCGAFVTVGGSNTWTGTNNFTGTFRIGGVTQTFPASGNLVGTSDTQTLTNKSIAASQINSGTLPATVMPAFTGDVTSSAGATVTTIAANAVTNAKMATSTQNTVKGAATSTAIADLTMPSCSGAANALQWLTSTGFQCGTLGATTAGWGVALSGGGVFSIATAQPPYGFVAPVNMGLTASVGASALTINLVGANGSAPSATNPVSIPFRSTTLATGTPVWTAITAATSIVIPSSATLGTSNSVAFRIWIFMTYNAGSPQLGVAVCSSSTTLYPCAAWEYTRQTSTAITGFATSSGVLYATAGVSNDAIRIIGFADYSAGLATAGAYVSVPTTLQVFGPGIKRPGEIVQTVRTTVSTLATGSTAIPGDNTIPQVGEGVQYLTQAITPTAAPNLLNVRVQGIFTPPTASDFTVAMFKNGGANAVTAMLNTPGASNASGNGMLNYLEVANSASAITYTIRAGNAAGGTITFNGSSGVQFYGGVANSYILVDEIMGFDIRQPANDNIDPGVFSATG